MTLQRIFTLDRVPLGKAEWLDSGALRAPARLGRVGVQQYEDPNTGRRFGVLRPPEEVFSADSLKSFEMVPVTNGHPADMVSPKNAKDLTIGTVAHVERDSEDPNYMRSMITIWDQAALDAFKAGRQELSNGYFAVREPAPAGSVYKDPVTGREEPYEFVQRQITGNHVALVDAGRAGPGARVFVDSVNGSEKGNGEIVFQIDAALVDRKTTTQETRKADMEKIIIDGVTFEVSTQVSQAIAKIKSVHEDAIKVSKAEADGLRGERDALKGQVTDLTAKLAQANDPKEIESRVNARLEIGEIAKKHGIADAAKMDLPTLQRAVIAKLAPNIQTKDQSDQYVAGVFATVTAKADGVGKSIGSTTITADAMPSGQSKAAEFRSTFFNQSATK